jgi:hypothetical protein
LQNLIFGTHTSILSMILVSTGTFAICLGAFLAAVFGNRFFLAEGFVALEPAPRTFAFFVVVRFAAWKNCGYHTPVAILCSAHNLPNHEHREIPVSIRSRFQTGPTHLRQGLELMEWWRRRQRPFQRGRAGAPGILAAKVLAGRTVA